MRRAPELQQLSRDHHGALNAALKLRRADAESDAEVAEHFLKFWREDGERHFAIEERILLPWFVAGHGDARNELVTGCWWTTCSR